LTLVALVALVAFIAVGVLRPAWRRGWGAVAEAPV
jgi:NNP family nitrate/nitrite transporter-like MFS transporter